MADTRVVDHATVSLTHMAGHLGLIVRDSGRGFNIDSLPKSGMEVTGMRERVALTGGTIEWNSKPGSGTQVSANFIFSGDAAEAVRE